MYGILRLISEVVSDAFQTCRFHEDYRAVKDAVKGADSLYQPVRFADELKGKSINYHQKFKGKPSLQRKHLELDSASMSPYTTLLSLMYKKRWQSFCNHCLPIAQARLPTEANGMPKGCDCQWDATIRRYVKDQWLCIPCVLQESDRSFKRAKYLCSNRGKEPGCQRMVSGIMFGVCTWCACQVVRL